MPELIDIRQYVRTLPTNTLMGFGAFAALTTFWYATRPKALKPPCDLSMQSVEVTGTTEGVRRSAVLEDDKLLLYYYDDVRTMYDGFQRGIQVSNDGPCLGSRKPNQPYEWISYKQVAEMAECIGSALIQKGFKPCSEQFIGIFSQNRPEVLTMSHLLCWLLRGFHLQLMGTGLRSLISAWYMALWFVLESSSHEKMN